MPVKVDFRVGLLRETDVDQDTWEYMRKKRRDVKVEPP
jgi:hypothetical protein